MADINRSTQETEKGSQPGGTRSATTGTGATEPSTSQTTGSQAAGQPASSQTGSATRQAREQSQGGQRAQGAAATTAGGSQSGTEMVNQMRENVTHAYDRASRTVNHTWEQAMDYGREHPGKASLIAFGAGLGVGLLMAGGMASRNRTRRIVPPVMNALTEIAREVFR